MPRITLHLYATFRTCAQGQASVDIEIQPGQSVRQTLSELGVPLEQTRIIFVNNCAASLDHPLQGGGRVGVFPAIGGG